MSVTPTTGSGAIGILDAVRAHLERAKMLADGLAKNIVRAPITNIEMISAEIQEAINRIGAAVRWVPVQDGEANEQRALLEDGTLVTIFSDNTGERWHARVNENGVEGETFDLDAKDLYAARREGASRR